MNSLKESIDRIAAETGFSGAVRIDRAGDIELAMAYGLARRDTSVANMLDTQFAIASGAKGFTALTVMILVDEGVLKLTTRARALLGNDLPLIPDEVTVEQLLAHRSGIGDYLDEETIGSVTEYVLPVPAHELVTTQDYLKVLDGHPSKFPPGKRFSYCNSGYVVLALMAERSTGTPFHELVRQRVCVPAGIQDTAFLRSDELPPRAAIGYLDVNGTATNASHLPARGSGDGGLYSTAADISTFWTSLFAGHIVPLERVAEMVSPHSDVPEHSRRYGLGFWLHPSREIAILEGYDAGVSFRTVHDPSARLTHTVLSNWTEGAWPLARHLNELLTP